MEWACITTNIQEISPKKKTNIQEMGLTFAFL